VPDGARFCPSCGRSLGVRGDERRIATVLFADLAGFTGMGESLDPEHLKNLVDRCFDRLAADITAHGGRVDKVVGDAIVALFGAPVAHEDDAERAVRAGLQMQETIAALDTELGLPLRIRVGINTGEVLVGAIRAGGDYTAMGDVVNVASRLQTMASPGTVVVGPATHAATSAVVRYRPLGDLQARGRGEAVEAWAAEEAMAPPGSRPHRVAGPLTGRDDELAVLTHAFRTAVQRRRAHLVVMVGDAGMGKSRLTDELARSATATYDALVLSGRAVPYGEANPWWPIAEAVRQACAIDPGDPADEAARKCRLAVAELSSLDPEGPEAHRLAAGLLHLMGDEEVLAEVDPQRATVEARRSLYGLVSGLSRRQPVLIVLSEMHWVDDVVLEFLGEHINRLGALPVMVVATARPELTERWNPPQGRHNLLCLHLDPLSREETRRLALALTEGEPTPELVDTLVERSGGNPFFLEELVAYIGESQTRAPSLRSVDLPVTLRGLVAARLDTLPAIDRSVLEDAAVIGRSGSRAALAALATAAGRDGSESALGALFSHDLLLMVEDRRWEFRSDVVREVVYETLTKSERARRHWSMASWLAQRAVETGREDEILEQIAHHYATAAELAGDVGPVDGVPADARPVAVAALLRAASWAGGRELPVAALRILDRAVALAGPEGAGRDQVLLERALARTTLRHLGPARDDLDALSTDADAPVRARALTIRGLIEQTEGDLAGSAATLAKALTEWEAVGDQGRRGEALRHFGMTLFLSSDLPAAGRALTEALQIARELGSSRDEAWALWHLAWLAFSEGDTAGAEERLEAAASAFRAAGDTGGLGWVDGLLGYVRMVQGRRDEAEALAVRVLADHGDSGDPWAMGMTEVLLATARLWQGRPDSAAELSRRAEATFDKIGDAAGAVRAASVLARALAASGRMADARRAAERADAGTHAKSATMEPFVGQLTVAGVAVHAGDWRTALEATDVLFSDQGPGNAEVLVLRGLALLQAGRFDEGRSLLETAAQAPSFPGARPNVSAHLALAHLLAGSPRSALGAANRALEHRPEGTYRDLAVAHVARAFAAAALGDAEEASAALAAATAQVELTEDRVTQAVVHLARSHVRVALGAPGADAALADAHAEFERLELTADGWDRVFSALAAARGL